MTSRDRVVFLGAAVLWDVYVYFLVGGASYHPAFGYAPEYEVGAIALLGTLPVLVPVFLPRRLGSCSLVALFVSCLIVSVFALFMVAMAATSWFSVVPPSTLGLRLFFSVTAGALAMAAFFGIRQHLRQSTKVDDHASA